MTEKQIREAYVAELETYLGAKEGDQRHRELIDLYNSMPVLPRGYRMTYAADWCVATAVAVIVIDRMDNKLKDYEQTMKGFGLPVLGVIPSLEEKSAEVSKMTNTEGEE